MNHPSYNSRMPSVVRSLALLLFVAGVWAQGPAAGPLTIVTKELPPASLWNPYGLEHAYGFPLQGEGGVAPYHWHIASGALPRGMKLDEGAGLITGTPEETGEFELTIQLSDKVESVRKKYILTIETPLPIKWEHKAMVSGNRIDGSIKVSNQTGRDFDLTFIVLAVNDIGRATALGYQHFRLKKETFDFELPFGQTLSPGNYVVNVDVVGEEPVSHRIFRARLVSEKESIAPVL